MTEINPATGFRKNHEEIREIYLTPKQVQNVFKVLKKMPHEHGANVIRLLLLTGSRLREVLNAEWKEFDLEQGVWLKPSSRTKQNRKQHLPLSKDIIRLLKQLRKDNDSIYVFPSTKTGQPRLRTH